MNIQTLLTASALATFSTSPFAHQHSPAVCGDKPAPMLSVADFNGDGKVTGKDISALAKSIHKGEYFSLYDRDADGDIDWSDMSLSIRDMGKTSSLTDQQLAQLYAQLRVLQTVNTAEQLYALGFAPITSSLAGHGVHWDDQHTSLPVTGVNVPDDISGVKGVYYSKYAQPLFNDSSSVTGLSSLDYPQPDGAWMYERVQAFANTPPVTFPESADENWHTHAGLCITVQDNGTGPVFVLDQHTSFMECQSIPSQVKENHGGTEFNTWINIWMLHIWMFDLNPAGIFANTHPCLDPHSPSESTINDDRVVPPFFSHHGD